MASKQGENNNETKISRLIKTKIELLTPEQKNIVREYRRRYYTVPMVNNKNGRPSVLPIGENDENFSEEKLIKRLVHLENRIERTNKEIELIKTKLNKFNH